MTLEQIKNDYAVKHGFDNWEDLVYQLGYNRPSRLLYCIDKVMILVQKECLKLASENIEWHEMQRIIDENNIIN